MAQLSIPHQHFSSLNPMTGLYTRLQGICQLYRSTVTCYRRAILSLSLSLSLAQLPDGTIRLGGRLEFMVRMTFA